MTFIKHTSLKQEKKKKSNFTFIPWEKKIFHF